MPSSSSPSHPTTTTPHPEALESDLLHHLTSTPVLEDLHSTLLSSLQRLGWTERIRKLAQELLRGGRCERFDEVFEAVIASAEGRRHPILIEANKAKQSANANTNTNTNTSNSQTTNGINDDDGIENFETYDVRIPQAVVDQGVRAIKEVLRDVVVTDDGGDILGDVENGHIKEEGGGSGGGATEKVKGTKNGDTASPVKKVEKKPKTGKQVK
ncbi:hypothetical protein BO94DRAFT_540373 [Aspergillus sclerotioniger CBS 115572]|uniref:Uncharacterized protein n=1 Tax=Aspergillus sclerotioniger CBS 115572 TaxID=1450535 RepID=A0A317V1Q3_9EURO|nr:hypothetical protein BO94DRAFT_540373 [Aspergillus sclerotioniger CBS 115572]PWY67579.1 hypothetical protein BO94DRAFT_540373 [Aspergillus sclerotioniger CBS 115572]